MSLQTMCDYINFQGMKKVLWSLFYYRIALIFHGSKFLRIPILKEFLENNSWMCVAHVHDSEGAKILAELIFRTIPNS